MQAKAIIKAANARATNDLDKLVILALKMTIANPTMMNAWSSKQSISLTRCRISGGAFVIIERLCDVFGLNKPCEVAPNILLRVSLSVNRADEFATEKYQKNAIGIIIKNKV